MVRIGVNRSLAVVENNIISKSDTGVWLKGDENLCRVDVLLHNNRFQDVATPVRRDGGDKSLYQFQFTVARRRLFTLPENKLFSAKWTRRFELETVLELPTLQSANKWNIVSSAIDPQLSNATVLGIFCAKTGLALVSRVAFLF